MPIATSTANTTGTTASTTASSSTKKVALKSAPTSTPYLALYCGIPRSSSGFSSARLPDDYNTMALFTSDDLYKINTATGAEQVLWSDTMQSMDVSNVKFFNGALFFVNRYDQKLYGLTFSNY
jgi:Tfp pilus assembly protein PilW